MGMKNPVLTAGVFASNSEQFPQILGLYVPPPARVLDMTYGNGVFWKQVDHTISHGAFLPNPEGENYSLWPNDLDPERGLFSFDLTDLPDAWEGMFDAVILDPPYLLIGGIRTLKDSIDRGYKNRESDKKSKSGKIGAVERLYGGGIIQAYKVLKRSGILIIKCMDQVRGGQQQWLSHDIMDMCRIFGFRNEDQLVFVNKNKPTMRHDTQKHARHNHSYWLVAKKRP
ncbi:hypothetical protein LCGC14_0593300 [marine sediment metagenome]|uniref:DNA methylase N-4/N-6 domain-containing protein n=1 Tax=marine sediment metagenome TaxID=412755 RepID=A0A0F9RWN6_9ZZZZ